MTGNVELMHTYNEDTSYTRSYLEWYRQINPYVPAMSRIRSECVVTGNDLMPTATFQRTEFFNDWVRPQGFVDLVGAALENDSGGITLFSIRRNVKHGLADARSRDAMETLLPHLVRVRSIARLIDRHQRTSRIVEDVLNSTDAAAFVLGKRAKLLQVNSAGEVLASAKWPVHVHRGTVSFVDIAAQNAFGRELTCASNNCCLTVLPKVIARSRGGPTWVAQILPLSGERRCQVAETSDAIAVLFVRPVSQSVDKTLPAVASRYRLTPAESRVLATLIKCDGLGLKQVASLLGVSLPTVKTHIQTIFDKTEVHRQADLVKLVLSFRGLLD